MEQIQYYIDELDKELEKVPYINQLDALLVVPKGKAYVAIAAGFIYILLLVFNVAGSLLTNLLGFLYPAYKSFKAIESHATDDDTQWLTYWTVYGFFTVIEFFTDILLHWLPFYYIIKAAVLTYLLLPQFRGAVVVYKHVIRPFLLSHQLIIDSELNRVKQSVQGAFKKD
ncbi:hypothetical protein MIR68_003517 [Amoeboaphelidium protococcarum]|nr:hypothetical protein MIR68_003517 [Amoeboaphelidium protococcarum]